MTQEGMVRPDKLQPTKYSDLMSCIVLLLEEADLKHIVYDLGGETLIAFGGNSELEVVVDEGSICIFHTKMVQGKPLLLGCDEIRQEDPDSVTLIEKWIKIVRETR